LHIKYKVCSQFFFSLKCHAPKQFCIVKCSTSSKTRSSSAIFPFYVTFYYSNKWIVMASFNSWHLMFLKPSKIFLFLQLFDGHLLPAYSEHHPITPRLNARSLFSSVLPLIRVSLLYNTTLIVASNRYYYNCISIFLYIYLSCSETYILLLLELLRPLKDFLCLYYFLQTISMNAVFYS